MEQFTQLSPVFDGSPEETQLLTETVWETLQRDLKEIQKKILIVLNPKKQNKNALRDWDLWGPLILTLILSVALGLTASSGQTSIVFTGVFSILIVGSAIVTLNFMLLGGNIAFFQSICAIGYCLFPISLVSVIVAILPLKIAKFILIPSALYWASSSLTRFFINQIPDNKKWLGLYPCFLLYSIICWIVIIH